MKKPSLASGYEAPDALAEYALPLCRAMLARGDSIAFALAGPAGTGKTEAAYWLAETLGLPIQTVDCALVREPRDFLGRREIMSDGTTGWQDSPFALAVESGNAVILLDELNRATPATANALLPLLDRRACAEVQERGKPLAAGPGIVWIATRNEGAEYTGTNRIDRALADRFPRTIRTDYMTKAQEAALLRGRTACSAAHAERIAGYALSTRKESGPGWPLSTRAALALAADMAAGIPETRAIHAMLSGIPDEDTREGMAKLAAAAGLGATQPATA